MTIEAGRSVGVAAIGERSMSARGVCLDFVSMTDGTIYLGCNSGAGAGL